MSYWFLFIWTLLLCLKKSRKNTGGGRIVIKKKTQPKTKPTLWTDLPIPTIYPSKQNNILIYKTSFLFVPCPCCHLLMFHGLYASRRRLQSDLLVCGISSVELEMQYSVQLYQYYLQDLFHFLFKRKYFCFSFLLCLSFLVSAL